MLRLGAESFTRGRSHFEDHYPARPEPTAKVFVNVAFKGIATPQLAQLDTGAAYSVVDPDTARELGVLEQGDAEEVTLRTHLGRIQGHLVRLDLTLVADEGEALDLEGIFFVSSDWPRGRILLGYSGLLDSLRFALDPPANHFYFGPSGPTE